MMVHNLEGHANIFEFMMRKKWKSERNSMTKAFTLRLKALKSAAAELKKLLVKDRNKQRRDLLMLNIQVHLFNKTAVQRTETQWLVGRTAAEEHVGNYSSPQQQQKNHKYVHPVMSSHQHNCPARMPTAYCSRKVLQALPWILTRGKCAVIIMETWE